MDGWMEMVGLVREEEKIQGISTLILKRLNYKQFQTMKSQSSISCILQWDGISCVECQVRCDSIFQYMVCKLQGKSTMEKAGCGSAGLLRFTTQLADMRITDSIRGMVQAGFNRRLLNWGLVKRRDINIPRKGYLSDCSMRGSHPLTCTLTRAHISTSRWRSGNPYIRSPTVMSNASNLDLCDVCNGWLGMQADTPRQASILCDPRKFSSDVENHDG